MAENEDRLDIASPRLDEFLGADEMRPFAPSERLRRLRALFAERPRERTPGLEELHPYRIMALWRIARLTLAVKGRLTDDERLETACATDPSPWDHPTRPVGRDLPRRGTGGLLARHMEGDGLPLICPEVSPAAPEGAPERELAARWVDAAGVAAGILGIGDTERGAKGLLGLLDAELAPRCCPTPEQLIAFEERLVSEAIELLIEHGEGATIRHYRTTYGLTRAEALTVIRLGRAVLRAEMEAPLEEKRAVAEAYLKRFIEDVAQTPNMRDRLLAIKELVRVQGVTREAPEDAMRDFVNVVRNISSKREALEGKRYERLGSGDATDAAFEVVRDDDDHEALADFDRENA